MDKICRFLMEKIDFKHDQYMIPILFVLFFISSFIWWSQFNGENFYTAFTAFLISISAAIAFSIPKHISKTRIYYVTISNIFFIIILNAYVIHRAWNMNLTAKSDGEYHFISGIITEHGIYMRALDQIPYIIIFNLIVMIRWLSAKQR